MLQNKLISLHTHTNFSDGDNSPEEMVQEAVRLGFSRIGFSEHSYISFEPDYCMPYDNYEAYRDEVRFLQEKYADRIEISLGIEQDYFSDHPAEGFDYIIGSVHFVKVRDEFIGIDWGGEKGRDMILSAADRYFDNDVYAVLELYFDTLSRVVEITGADIIGHFDVITKVIEQYPFFDLQHPRYVSAWKKAADVLLQKHIPFEINVSQVLKGTKSVPYPAPDIQLYLKERGAEFIYTGDCHSTGMLRKFAGYLQE